MSDIDDYLSDNDSNSVSSVDSIEKKNKKPFKNPIVSINKTKMFTDLEENEEGDAEGSEIDDEDIENDEMEINLDDVDEDIVPDDEDDDDDEDEDEDEDEDDEDYYDEEMKQKGGEKKTKKNTSTTNVPKKINNPALIIDTDDEDEDDDNENYLQKFDNDINRNYIKENHPECIIHNNDEVKTLSEIVRDANNIIIDPFHRTIPFLTKYEKARILGQRAKQIESGANPFVKVPENIIDGYVIAELELQQKKIPFVIRRPLPNGGCEYWNLRDLELISF